MRRWRLPRPDLQDLRLVGGFGLLVPSVWVLAEERGLAVLGLLVGVYLVINGALGAK